MDLPFDLAQGGELVEPFRISIFGFRIYHKLNVENMYPESVPDPLDPGIYL